MTLAELIKRRRAERGQSLQGVADAAGMSKAGIHSLETGATIDPSVSSLLAISRALKLKPEVMLAATRESLEAPQP